MNTYLNKTNESAVARLLTNSSLRSKYQSLAVTGKNRAILDCAKHAGVNVNTMRAAAYYW